MLVIGIWLCIGWDIRPVWRGYGIGALCCPSTRFPIDENERLYLYITSNHEGTYIINDTRVIYELGKEDDKT